METVTGYVEHIVFRNEENGYTVFRLENDDGEVTCVGSFNFISEGEMLELTGEYVNHNVYGTQLKVISHTVKEPEDLVSIERYLGSGAIKGVGAALAGRIVKKFKKDTFRIIEEEPERLAEIKGIDARRIFIGNGSDEAIDLAFRIFCRPGVDNAVSIAPTYGMYRVAASTNDVEMREVALGEDFSLPVDALLAAADEHTHLMWLCSPNNPTGNLFPPAEIERLLRAFDGMVVLDEAYIDFADDRGFLPRLDEFPNLIVLQTLSKAWGMAGLRIGLAFASEEVISLFARVKYPYNLSCLTQRVAEEQLAQLGFFPSMIAPTENFEITPSGITFHYDPYEIACYAIGEVEVPFTREELGVK